MSESTPGRITEEASEWFEVNRERVVSASDRAAFTAWLRVSPLHVREYLELALLASDLRSARDPAVSIDGLVAMQPPESARIAYLPGRASSATPGSSESDNQRRARWPLGLAAAVLVALALFAVIRQPAGASALYATRHGEQRVIQLPDSSVLHLDTDTIVELAYSRAQRSVTLEQGQAMFEVAHDPGRPFRVTAGAADIVAVGTGFDVYRQGTSTLIVVVTGQVAVTPAHSGGGGAIAHWKVPLHAGEQVRISDLGSVGAVTPVDVRRVSAWLQRRLVFEREPLQQVAAEFNRYGALPVRIEAPELQILPISGEFGADDAATFIAFLRSLDGVNVTVSPSAIEVRK